MSYRFPYIICLLSMLASCVIETGAENSPFKKVLISTNNETTDFLKTQTLLSSNSLSGLWVANLHTRSTPIAYLTETLSGIEIDITDAIKETLQEMENTFVASILWRELFPPINDISANWSLRLRQEPGTGFTWSSNCEQLNAPFANLLLPKDRLLTTPLEKILPKLGRNKLVAINAGLEAAINNEQLPPSKGNIIANSEIRFDPLLSQDTSTSPVKALANTISNSELLSLAGSPLTDEDKQEINNFFASIEAFLPGFELLLKKGVNFETTISWKKVSQSTELQIGNGQLQENLEAAPKNTLNVSCYYAHQTFKKLHQINEQAIDPSLTNGKRDVDINNYTQFYYLASDSSTSKTWEYHFQPTSEAVENQQAVDGNYLNTFRETHLNEPASFSHHFAKMETVALSSTSHTFSFILPSMYSENISEIKPAKTGSLTLQLDQPPSSSK